MADEAIVEDGGSLADLRPEQFALIAGVFAQARPQLSPLAPVSAPLAKPQDRSRAGSWGWPGMPRPGGRRRCQPRTPRAGWRHRPRCNGSY